MSAARLAALVCLSVSITAEVGSAQVNGYLVIQGGGALTNEVKDRFVALAGGPRARFVYIPTALSDKQIGDAEKRGTAIAKQFIDYCESCRGYLKTYDGEGSETIMLADWTSIHLDVIACDRGLKRLAASLYQL